LAISPFISAAEEQLKWYFHFRVCTCCSKGSEWKDVGGLRRQMAKCGPLFKNICAEWYTPVHKEKTNAGHNSFVV